jgi:hypothetical protein
VDACACDAPFQDVGNLDRAPALASGLEDLTLNFHRSAKYDRLSLSKFSHSHTSFQ